MKVMYTILMLLQPAQRHRDDDIVKILLLTIGSGNTNQTRFANQCFHRDHHGVKLEVCLCKRNRRDPGDYPLVTGWYEAVV